MLNITTVNNYNNINFKALKVATMKTYMRDLPINIDLYRLQREDQKFIEKLSKKIDYKKLFPKLKLELQKRWQEVFDYCMMKAENRDNITYVGVHDNKICGIITYHNSCGPVFLDGICTIPTDANEKVPFCGQTLLYKLFKDAKFLQSKGITLDAITDGPFDVVNLYEKLGFRKDYSGRIFGYVPMSCTVQKMNEQLKKFSKYIEYTPVKKNTEQKTDLMQFID